MSGAAFNRGRSRQDYATPWPFVQAVERRFGPITWDLAATAENAKASRWIGPQRDALSVFWDTLEPRGLMWLNPPFGKIAPWAARCAFYAEEPHRLKIALLVPAAVGSEWFARWVWGRAGVFFLRPRLSFDGQNPYPKDCLLALYGHSPGCWPWRWDDEAEQPMPRFLPPAGNDLVVAVP